VSRPPDTATPLERAQGWWRYAIRKKRLPHNATYRRFHYLLIHFYWMVRFE